MSIASRITKIEEHITNAYDGLEDLGIDLTNVDKNIDNIASMLEEVWEEQPKVTATDIEETTLENTKKGRMNIDLKGNTKQAITILPSEYQQVEYIECTGTQYIDTGIIPKDNIGIKISGSPTGGSGDRIIIGSSDGNRFFIYLPTGTNSRFGIGWNTNKTYIYIINTNTKYNIFLNFKNDRKVIINDTEIDNNLSNLIGNNKNLYLGCNNGANGIGGYYIGLIYSLQISENANIVRNLIPCYRKSDDVIGMYDLVTNTFFTNQGTGTFNKGNNVSVPNPDYPQPIRNVSGNANIKIQNKNLFDINNINDLANYSGKLARNNSYRGYTLPVKAGETYTISRKAIGTPNRFRISFTIIEPDDNVVYYNRNGQREQMNNFDNDLNATITVPNNMNYMFLYLSNNNETITENMQIQIEEGTTVTSYVPHAEQNYPLTLGNIELCKIDTAQDYFYKDSGKWYLHKEIGKKIFNGNNDEDWHLQTNSNKYNFYISVPEGVSAGSSPIYCNIGIYSTQLWEKNFATYISQSGNLNYRCDSFTAVQDFKTFLGRTNMIYYYILKNPINTEILDTTLINQLEAIYRAKSYNDKTIISSTSDEEGFIMDVESLRKNVN